MTRRDAIEDGALHGTNVKSEKDYGHLVSEKTYGDFTVRLMFKALKGNSGLYFRIEEKGFSGVTGLQAEIDAEKDAGGLYETNGRAWVVQTDPAAEPGVLGATENCQTGADSFRAHGGEDQRLQALLGLVGDRQEFS